MADELERPGETPEHEDAEAHLPAPTIWPFAFAGAVALILLGLIVSYWATVIGIVLAVVFGFLWIRQVTREVRGEPEPVEEPVAAAAEPDEEEGEEGPARYERSKFLEGATIGLGAAIGAIVTLPVLGFAVAPAFVGQEYPDGRPGAARQLPRGRLADRHLRVGARRRKGEQAHGLHPQQRPQGRRSQLLDHLQPLRPHGLPDAAAGTARRAAQGRDLGDSGRADAHPAVRLRVPVPRRRLRRRGQPNGRAARPRARPLRVLDHRRGPVARAIRTASPRSKARAPMRLS